MNKPSRTLVFFGSGPLAAKSLGLLLGNFDVEAVITKTAPLDKAIDNPVIEVASRYNIKLLFSNNSQELTKLFEQWRPASLMGIVIDYGIIISQFVIDKFSCGIINSHFSLLPQWRGADPITYALLAGQSYTGVSLMQVNNKLDEGDILVQKKVAISNTDNNTSLSSKLIVASNELLNSNLDACADGKSKPAKQTDSLISYSRKINKSDGLINWHKPASVIEREVRAYNSWPGSYVVLGNINVIIHEAKIADQPLKPGKLLITANKDIYVGCGVKTLQLLSIQPNGKKPMLAKDFINGYQKQIKT
jgi:methionyl-tRNA formyltransferase